MRSRHSDRRSAYQRVRIRHTQKNIRKGPLSTPLALQFGRMSRPESLSIIQNYLALDPLHPLAQSLIDLFQIHGEELTEIGVPYETVKALEKEYPLLHCLKA